MWKKNGFKRKLTFILWTFFLIPSFTFGIFTFAYSTNDYKKTTEAALQSTLDQISLNINTNLQGIKRIADFLVYDDFLQVEKIDFSDYERYTWLKKKIDDRMRTILPITIHQMRIIFYLDNDTIPELYYTDSEVNKYGTAATSDPLNSNRYEVLKLSRIHDESWYADISKNSLSDFYIAVGSDDKFGNISYIRTIRSKYDMSTVGIVRIVVKASKIFSSSDLKTIPYTNYFSVEQANGGLMYSAMSTNPIPATEQVRFAKKLPSSNMTAHLVIPSREINRTIFMTAQVLIWITIICSLLLVFIYIIFFRYFSGRIAMITDAIREYRYGNTVYRINVQGNDEFDQIAHTFNEMAERNKALFEDNIKKEMARKDAEMLMLQAQINPHFLYNMLSSISQLSQAGRNEESCSIALRLADFYRMTLSKKDILISLEKEFEQVKAYLDIMKIKYMDRLSATLTFPAEFADYQTPRFILQPFVENAIVHAWSDSTLNIVISGRLDNGKIRINITDNGIGMDEETVQYISSKSNSSGRYGIRSVDERIKLLYGTLYGVAINSDFSQGTNIELTLPAIPYKHQGEE